uniref:Alternative protein n=1 Tax=Macrostomum lignano TaxID=282301 RepID=A0A1I8JQ57_9PLAT
MLNVVPILGQADCMTMGGAARLQEDHPERAGSAQDSSLRLQNLCWPRLPQQSGRFQCRLSAAFGSCGR